MLKDIADKWVAALRSGKYQQGIGHLKHGDKFCCLGVLCDLLPGGKWEGEAFYLTNESSPTEAILPHAVVLAAEMSSAQGQLAEANDAGYTFTEIADLIEKHYKTM